MKTIKEVLMQRDNMSAEEATDLINDAKEDLHYRLENDEDAFDICADWFGLEPDYIMDLI